MALVKAQRSVSIGDRQKQVQVLIDGLVESGSENGGRSLCTGAATWWWMRSPGWLIRTQAAL